MGVRQFRIMLKELPKWQDCICDQLFKEGGPTCILPNCANNFYRADGVLPCSLDYKNLGLDKVQHVAQKRSSNCVSCGGITAGNNYCRRCYLDLYEKGRSL